MFRQGFQLSIAIILTCGQLANAAPSNSDFMSVVRHLQNQALSHNAHYRNCVSQLHKESSAKERRKARAADMANYAILFKGVSPSTEGGDAILKDKLPPRSLAAAAFDKQQMEDQMQRKLASQILEMAMGMGNADKASGNQQVNHASAMLRRDAGASAAAESATFLRGVTMEPTGNGSGQWSVQRTQADVSTAVKIAATRDPVIGAIKAEVHKYNRHKKGALGAQRVTRTALSAASLTPTIIGPAAQVVLFGELLGTGGTEQDKLLKELYIDKRFESRIGVLTELSHTAIYYYHLGISSHNQVLAASSKNLLVSLVGPNEAAALTR